MKWIDRFRDPENAYKPKVRYWMPHAFVDADGLARDVADLDARGFGSIEAVTMHLGVRPGLLTPENMWGSDRWIAAVRPLLRAAGEHGMTVDMANGPGWPIANVCTRDPNDETTLYELAYGLHILEGGEQYAGDPPMPEGTCVGTRRLLTVATYRIVGEGLLDFSTYRALDPSRPLSVSAPQGERWALFAFWEQPSSQRNAGIFPIIDHFSTRATDAVMDLWEEKILPGLGEDRQVLRSIFCDSLEYHTQMDWSRGFDRDFAVRKGYSLLPYLPCLGSPRTREVPERNRGVFPPTNVSGYEFSDPDLQHRVNFDYFEMLSHCYNQRHLAHMCRRAHAMGLTVRYQVAYNKNLEAESAARYTDIPENEGLGRPLLDNYRNMAAAVHLDRKSIYSFECAAEMDNAYGQTHEDLLWWAKRAYIGGMNAQVIHGASYCGYYHGAEAEKGLVPGVDWPGYEGFGKRSWSNAWNRTLDIAGQKNAMTYLARCNFLLQNRHRVDLAVYQNRYTNKCFPGAADGAYILRDRNALNDAGYTYEFFSPSLMEHENARVEGGVLDPQGAAYRALILSNEEYMPIAAARHLLAYARAGLPIFFVGCLPRARFYESEAGNDEELRTILRQIPYIFVETVEMLVPALREYGILPDALPPAPCGIRSVRVEVEGADFYYLHNTYPVVYPGGHSKLFFEQDKSAYMSAVDGVFSLCGEGDVYELDAYSGRVVRYHGTTKHGRTEVALHFAPDEAKILAVLTEEQACALGIPTDSEPSLAAIGEIPLPEWTLTLERVLPPVDGIGTFYETRYEKEAPVRLTELKPWHTLRGEWQRAAGIGRYETTFSWDGRAARVCLQVEQACDTYTITLNGKTFTAIDLTRKETDLTDALRIGENELTVTVASPLANAVLDKEPQSYGMWGKVCLLLYS